MTEREKPLEKRPFAFVVRDQGYIRYLGVDETAAADEADTAGLEYDGLYLRVPPPVDTAAPIAGMELVERPDKEAIELVEGIWFDMNRVRRETNLTDVYGMQDEDCARQVLEFCDRRVASALTAANADRDRLQQELDMLRAIMNEGGLTAEKADLEAAEADRSRLARELEWYGEQARLARLIHSEGDAGRHALAADGGKRARAALGAA